MLIRRPGHGPLVRMVNTVPWLVMLLSSAVLSGCVDEGAEPLEGESALDAGLGVIEGVLLDERFRPIELTERPTTDFQAEGFILVAETGEQLQTNVNGEFASAPLQPGTYTLRPNVAGHEAVAQAVRVEAGEVAQTDIIARRVANLDDLQISWDMAVFIPCNVTILVQPIQGDCFGDQSGDSTRFSLFQDLSEFEGTRFLLTEFYLNKVNGDPRHGTYQVQITGPAAEGDGVTTYNYAIKPFDDGHYDRVLLERGVLSEHQAEPLLTYGTWEEMGEIGWFVSGQGLLRPELQSVGSPFSQGIGPQVGMKAQMLVTLFYTDDRTAAEAFCGLCA